MQKLHYIKSLILIGFIFIINSNLFAQDTINSLVPNKEELTTNPNSIFVSCPPHYSSAIEMYFGANLMGINFNDFENALGKENIDFINLFTGFDYDLGLGYYYKKFNGVFEFGYNLNDGSNKKGRNINIKLSTTKLGLLFGYRVIDTKHFFISPELAFRYYRFRLNNWNKGSKKSLEEYVDNRDLDIRFHQLTGYGGLSFAYKLPTFYREKSLYVRLSGGYYLKLNNKPWITSADSKITTNNKLDITYGINFGLLWVSDIWQ